MVDADLFLELAGIAGVFVGFGALIAVRGGGASRAEIAPMRTVVSLGVLAIIGAVTPVALSRFGIVEHALWASSSATVLVGWVVGFAAMMRTPEYREGWQVQIEARRATRSASQAIWIGAYALYILASLLVPIVIALGLAPAQEGGLYFTVVLLVLLGAAWTLLQLVFTQGPAAATSAKRGVASASEGPRSTGQSRSGASESASSGP